MDNPEGAPSLLIPPACCVGSYFLLIVEMFLGACCFTVTPWYRMMLLPSPTPTPPWIIPDEKKYYPTGSLVYGDDCGYIWLCVWTLPNSRKTQTWGLRHLPSDVQEGRHQRARRRVIWGVGICFFRGSAGNWSGLLGVPFTLWDALPAPQTWMGTIFTVSGSDSSSPWRWQKANPGPGLWPLQLFGWRPYRLLTV